MKTTDLLNYERVESLLTIIPMACKIIETRLEKEKPIYNGAVNFMKEVGSISPEKADDAFIVMYDTSTDEKIEKGTKSVTEIAEKANRIIFSYETVKESLNESKRFVHILESIQEYILKGGPEDEMQERVEQLFGKQEKTEA